MEMLFWASAALVAYVYVGYPLALALWALAAGGTRGAGGTGAAGAAAAGVEPAVSIVIAVRNEAHRLRARIENLLSLDYSGERQIIVVSDGSTDHPERALADAPANV